MGVLRALPIRNKSYKSLNIWEGVSIVSGQPRWREIDAKNSTLEDGRTCRSRWVVLTRHSLCSSDGKFELDESEGLKRACGLGTW